jgi:hypothetical protein
VTSGPLPGSASPYNVTSLQDALVRRLEEAFEEFRLPNQNPDATAADGFDHVTVFLGALDPIERGEDGQEIAPPFPLVVVTTPKWIDGEGEGGARSTTVMVDIEIGVRRLNKDGHRDVTAVAECIRTNLLRDPKIENHARLVLPLETEIGKQDAFPQWVGVVTARLNIPQPVEEAPDL